MQLTPARFWMRQVPFAMSILAYAAALYLQLADNPPQLSNRYLVALAFAAAVGPVAGTTFESVNWKDQRAGDKISTEVIALHEALCELGTFNNLNIGYTVFRLRHSSRPPFWRIQARIYRLRLTANPKPSCVRWVKRKGLLGRCWREQEVVHLDHEVHFAGIEAAHWWDWWFRVPNEVRQWLSFSDYKSIRKYKQVTAYPLEDTHSGAYRGCLVVQVPDEHIRERLTEPDAVRVLERVTAAIANQLS